MRTLPLLCALLFYSLPLLAPPCAAADCGTGTLFISLGTYYTSAFCAGLATTCVDDILLTNPSCAQCPGAYDNIVGGMLSSCDVSCGGTPELPTGWPRLMLLLIPVVLCFRYRRRFKPLA